jgi:hypothetical protein
MPRPGLAYEKASRVSRALIACFGLAVVVMAGWLGAMILFPSDAPTQAAIDPSDVPAMATKPAPRVENTATAYDAPLANGPQWPEAPSTNPYSPPPPPVAQPAPANGRPAGYATSALAPYDNVVPAEAGNDSTESVPLPPPRPKRVAAVPVPRPRPHIDEPVEAPPKERSFFDILVGR